MVSTDLTKQLTELIALMQQQISTSANSKQPSPKKNTATPATSDTSGLNDLAIIMQAFSSTKPSKRVEAAREAVEVEKAKRALYREKMATRAEAQSMAQERRRTALMARLDRLGVPYDPSDTVGILERRLAEANRSRKKTSKIGPPRPSEADLAARMDADRLAEAESRGAARLSGGIPNAEPMQ